MTAPPIRSDDLLDVARLLASVPGGRGWPRTAQLRRAVSTAYYALFHELVGHATAELCGEGEASEAERRRASRWFAHTDLRVLAEAAARAGGSSAARAVASVIGSPHEDLAKLADTFVMLQEERYHADYDHEHETNRSAALFLVEQAADAIGRARRLARTGDRSYQRFLRLMVGAVKIARTRSA